MLPALPSFAPTAAAALVAAAWQGVALALIVALCLRLLPNLSAALRSTVWLGVLAAIAVLHFTPALTFTLARTHAAPLHVAAGWSLALVALWAACSLLRLALLARSALHLRRVSQRAVPMNIPAELAPLLVAGRRRAQLCLSTEVDRPSVAGFFSPRILLPAGLIAKLSGDELAQIVLHEMQHLLRRDDWTNLAQKFALALFPLNPALVWIERRLCLERELACDDGVLRITSAQRSGARKAYATMLANLAEHSLVRRGASLALAAWSRRSELATRVQRILFRPAATMTRRQTAAATTLLTLTVLGGAATLAHAPQLVSFAPAANSIAEVHAPTLTTSAPASFSLAEAHATLVRAVMPAATPANLPAPTRRTTAHRRTPHLIAANAHPQPAPFRAIQTMATVNPQPSAPVATASLDPDTAPQPAAQPPAQPPATWFVVARWEYIVPNQQPAQPAAQPRGRRAAPDPSPDSTYAALPMPGGWLILQL